MTKKNNKNRGKASLGVTPQGYAEDERAHDPKTKLENAAKKDNTRI
ncbi:small acid-soluble spore protein L (minor) [Peribacillus deserti]|uniref:Small, acid-soluble spore protein L n=2 Tax=Peribacillus deserti TaxID=673318 RepID=A0A2N5M215_9BACI|nr:small, acid-soluble spore protein L [Peribacillus deserti]MBM7692577.1 small acid-soluble spore protein L (minor) [Peribacillus deserti]PLT28391.1 small, acid-soluble spore protein L [Peribacillus deserti]